MPNNIALAVLQNPSVRKQNFNVSTKGTYKIWNLGGFSTNPMHSKFKSQYCLPISTVLFSQTICPRFWFHVYMVLGLKTLIYVLLCICVLGIKKLAIYEGNKGCKIKVNGQSEALNVKCHKF